MFYSGLLSTPAEFDAFFINTEITAPTVEPEHIVEVLYTQSPAHIKQV